MTLKKEMCELSSRARAFSVEALIGVKRQRTEENSEQSDIHQTRRHEDLLPCNKLQKSATTLSKTAIANGKNTTSGTGSVESTAETQRRLKLKQNLKVELCSRDLWRKFHSLGTEMIITKAGRRMFPTVKVRLTGLDPAASYIVFLDIIPVDDKRYRYVYHSSQWMVAGSGDPPLPHNLYVHPDSPATGQLWMAQGVVAFDKLKLTNNRKPLVRGQVSLHSMHKYLPRVHILQTTDLDTPPEQQARVERALTYTFPETTFTTVTAYQNQQITRLKIASNPFAKGFREASRTRDTLDDSGHTKPQEYPPPSLIGSSKLCSAEMFGLHQDFNLFHPSSSLYLPGRSSLDPYCQSNSLPVSFLHTTHSPYSCQPGPLHPLTMPVKFVVPPSTGGIVSGLGSRLSLEENSAFDRCNENIKQFISAEQSKRVYVDNYSRIVLDENTTTRYNNEHLSNVCTLTLPKRTPTSRNEELGSLNVVDEEINQSSNQLPKFISGGSSKSPFGDHFKEHSSKNLVIRKFPEEEFPSETRNLWKCQKTLIESVQCKNSERKLTEQNETLSITKITTTTPLDLTKLK